MRKQTPNNDIFGDHITSKLEDAGNVDFWNRMMAEDDGPVGTVNPTHGLSKDRATATGDGAPRSARASNVPLDSLKSVPVHGMKGVTAATLAQQASAKARKKPRI